jgi:hypothetical protein
LIDNYDFIAHLTSMIEEPRPSIIDFQSPASYGGPRSKVWRIQGIYAISSKFGKFPVNIGVASLEKPIRRPGYRARAP